VSINASTHFSDAVAFGLGAEYRLNPQWTLSAGISYAGSPVHDKDRNPSLPFDRQIRYGGGVRYAWRDDVTVAFSYEFLDLGDADVNTTFGGGTLEGDFDPNHAHFLALTVSKRF
jgi:long-chain fatty acid transport protein